MPNRLIREGFLDSEAIHALSDAAECFFHRLMLAADDAGRMDGRVEILRARLFPLDISRRASDVEKTLAECVAHGLVIPYVWHGNRYLQIAKWQRSSPCVTSKFPWNDGSFRIHYVKVDTRDGEKDFVASSVPIAIPSARDTDGIGPVIPRMYGDGDVYEDGNEGVPASDDAAPPAAKKPKGETCTLATFLARCRESGVDAIPADDPVHAYADRVGLPGDYVRLAWRWFKAKYGPDGSGKAKRYTDWRAHFRNAVKDGWPKYWAIDGQGAYYLTTAGKQAEREAQE